MRWTEVLHGAFANGNHIGGTRSPQTLAGKSNWSHAMVKQHSSNGLAETNTGPPDAFTFVNFAATWLGYYVIAFLLILLTNPITSKSNAWSGIGLAYIAIMLGAGRLASLGVAASTLFVYGCASSLLILVRVLFLSRIELWGAGEPPSNGDTIGLGIAFSVSLGLLAVCICFFLRSQNATSVTYPETEVE